MATGIEMADLEIKIIQSADDMEAAFDIRRLVFRVEQGVSEEEEFDGLDGGARQYLMTLAGKPVGTARSRNLTDRLSKVERVAVVQEQRGFGFGRELMDFVIQDLWCTGAAEITINAQKQVIPFYQALGFVPAGAEFMEAEIPHRKMDLKATNAIEQSGSGR